MASCTEGRSRHSYPRGEPKGSRVCLWCHQSESLPSENVSTEAAIESGTMAFTPLAPSVESATPQPISASSGAKPATASLPEHSGLGASSMERWSECPGSYNLINALKLPEADEPEYQQGGTQAHSAAAACLDMEIDAWEAMNPARPLFNAERANGVQVYLDYVRSRPGRREVELKVHRPELHELFFGTLDCALTPVSGQDGLVLEIVDFKDGVGVVVSADGNVQLSYYAVALIMDDPTFYPDEGRVRLTIVQPRAYHPDGPIRSWDTTVGQLKEWLHAELLPAMTRATAGGYLSLGKWCQFCPARLCGDKLRA